MPSRLASGAYRSRVSRANSTEQGVLLSACQRSVRSARPAASARCAGRRPWPAASCAAFPLRTARRRRRWRAGPPRPVAAAPRALHQPRHFLANAVATGSLRSAGAGAVRSVGKAASRAARVAASVCMPARMRTTPAPCEASDSRSGPAGPRSAARPRPRPGRSAPGRRHPGHLPPPCRQEASKGVGASGTGEADMTGKLGGLQGNDQNISTLYTSVCPH